MLWAAPAEGVASISASEDPAAIAIACLGSGLRRAKVDLELRTSPSISG